MIDELQARLVRFGRRVMTRPRIDIPLVHHNGPNLAVRQQVRNRAFHPGVVAVFIKDSRVPLQGTRCRQDFR